MSTLEQDIKRFESWQKLEDLFEYAASYNIHVIKGKRRDKNKAGIHLLDTDYNELNEAIEQAALSGQQIIWCHDSIQFTLKLIKGDK
jgi:predicted peroxiredoxin